VRPCNVDLRFAQGEPVRVAVALQSEFAFLRGRRRITLLLTSTVNPYKLLISKGLLFLLGTTFSFSDETPDHF